MAHEFNGKERKPNKGKIEANWLPTLSPTIDELKSFLGTEQNFAKILRKHSEKIDRIGHLLRTHWERKETVEEEEFKEPLKKKTRNLCLAHSGRDRDQNLKNRLSKAGLGITLWQKQNDSSIRPKAFSSKHSNNAEKQNSAGKLESLVVWH